MADNDPSIYNSKDQIEFARAMAKTLLGQGNYVPDAAMAKLPGTWMYGVPNIIRAISGAQYRDVAGDRTNELASRVSGEPNIPANRYGARISQPKPVDNNDPGTYSPKVFNPSAEYGSSDDFLRRVAMIESGGDPNARTGSYRGRYQFGKAEEARYGLNDSNWNNPKEQERAIREHMTWLHPQLEKSLGRAPTPGELYLAHQQGVAGAPALINNPDEPAWKAIRPYYRSDEMAKLAVRGNIPKGSPLSKIPVEDVKAKDFSRMWTSRFDDMNIDNSPSLANSIPPPIQAQETSPMPKPPMGLGGPPATPEPTPKAPVTPLAPGNPTLGVGVSNPALERENQPTAQQLGGPQLAQATVPNQSTVTDAPQVSPNLPMPGQYQGPVPPANPVMTRKQFDALIRSTPMEKWPEVVKQHFDSLEGRTFKAPGGGQTIVTPQPDRPGSPIVTNIPGGDIDLGNIAGLNVKVRQNPNGGMDLILPGGKVGGTFKDIEGLVKEVNRIAGEGETSRTSTTKIGGAQVEPITEAISVGNTASNRLQTLRTMEGLAKSTDQLSMGPTSPFMNEAKRLISNFLGPNAAPGIAQADSIEKLSSLLASESTKAVSANRGTNFELAMFTRANPNLMQSKEGMLMMIDILKQEVDQQAKLAKIANQYRGKDPATWQARKDEFYNDNPITVKMPMPDGKVRSLTTKRVNDPKDLEDIPSGTYFIMPDGRLGRKP